MDKKLLNKNAFTVAELIIVLLVIGILAIIMIGSMFGSSPDKIKVLFKKAYSVCERTVGELVNDETFYPYDPERVGFLNTDKVKVPGNDIEADGDTKFCTLFYYKLNTIGDIQIVDNNCHFETSDGILWWIPVVETKEENYPIHIKVDVNGESQGPNSDDETNPKQDQFTINVFSDGRVNVTGEREIEYLRSHSATEDKRPTSVTNN